MRLLGVDTLKVVGFAGRAPAYAILSHTWEDEEITLQQLDDLDAASSRKGFRKLKNACAIAKADGYAWIWIDTCCIDKTSSAELSEAINSMFQWYHQAEICYAYISDVSDVEFKRVLDPRAPYFPQCRWLTRGWTLQELIAPQELQFFSQNWKMVGSKESFAEILSHATRIPPEVLKAGDVSGITVCEKMRWIASRETTRPEDIAYCVLGIFDINMPLLYGEGSEKAFRRLQEEILRVSDDPTIFLWTADHDEPNDFWGLLARSPSQFKSTPMGIDGLNSIASVPDSSTAVTSQGLEVSWQVAPVRDDPSKALLVAFLARKKRIMYAILLQQMDYAGFRFARVAAHTKVHVVIAGGGREAILCPAGPHDAAHFPLQRIHPGDTHSKRFSVKQDPIPRNPLTRKVAVGFSLNMSSHEKFKVEPMESDELPELGFESFHLQKDLLFHRFIKNDIDLESKTGKSRMILAALSLKVSAKELFYPPVYWSEPFYMVLAISPVDPSSIGTVSPFVQPQAFFPPEEYRLKPLQSWLDSHTSGATFWTDYINVRAGPFTVTVRCSFKPNMLLAEPYYGIVLSTAQEEFKMPPSTSDTSKSDTPKFSFSNTQPNTQPNARPPNSEAPRFSFSNTQPNTQPPNSSPTFNTSPNSEARPFASSFNTTPNTQHPNPSSIFNTSPNSEARPFASLFSTTPNAGGPGFSFPNTQPNIQHTNSSSIFGASPSSGASTFESGFNTTPNAGGPSFSFLNTPSNTAASPSSGLFSNSGIGNNTATTGRPYAFGNAFGTSNTTTHTTTPGQPNAFGNAFGTGNSTTPGQPNAFGNAFGTSNTTAPRQPNLFGNAFGTSSTTTPGQSNLFGNTFGNMNGESQNDQRDNPECKMS